MKLINPLKVLLDRVQARFRVSRPGSVLILVVALLVLMALIGTAYISTARIDRYAIRNNAFTNQLGLAAESVRDMTVGALVNDLFNGPQYRGVTIDPEDPSLYENFDGSSSSTGVSTNMKGEHLSAANGSPLADPNDGWLMPRLPRLVDPEVPMSTNNPPIWDGVSYPPFENVPANFKDVAFPWQFDPPDMSDDIRHIMLSMRKPFFEPTIKTINGVAYPALRMRHYSAGPGNTMSWDYQTTSNANLNTFLAADADGDGVADAGLFRLPIGETNGIRWYAAVRTIDNNSAVNVNTAWAHGDANFMGIRTSWANDPNSTDQIEKYADQLNTWYYPSSVDMGSLFRSFSAFWLNTDAFGNMGDEMMALNKYRWASLFTPGGIDTKQYPNAPFVQSYVYDDNDVPRAWYGSGSPVVQPPVGGWPTLVFASVGDALNAQLARRIDNPGNLYDINILPGKGQRVREFKSFGADDTAALTYHFCLINPTANRSPLEDLFYQSSLGATVNKIKDSIYTSAANYANRTRAYPLTLAAPQAWFKENFAFDLEDINERASATAGGYYRPRRPLLVVSNPVSNQTPRREMTALFTNDKGGVIAGAGPNAEVVGPQILPANLIHTNSIVTGLLTYGNYYTTTVAGGSDKYNQGNVDLVWGEQMPFWSKQNRAKYTYSEYFAPKASANTSNFGELWRAYWNVMAEGDGTRTPFDRGIEAAVNAAIANRSASLGYWGGRNNAGLPGDGWSLNDPYVGQKFWGQTAAGSTVPSFLAEGDNYHYAEEVPPNFDPTLYPQSVMPAGWNPARMFRGSIRTIPYTSATTVTGLTDANRVGQALTEPPFDTESARINPDQQMLLRAAIAAVNTEDARDSDFDNTLYDKTSATTQPLIDPNSTTTPKAPLRGHGTGDVTAHRIVLRAVLKDPRTWTTGAIPHPTADKNAIAKPIDVVVYGNEKQPFITEVFVSTRVTGGTTHGYVAVELYNPYEEDIELTNWKLVALDRRHDANVNPSGTRSERYGIRLDSYPRNPPFAPNPSTPQMIADFDPDRSREGFEQVYPFTRTRDAAKEPTPLIVPRKGYLLLENYADQTALPGINAVGTAEERPLSTRLTGLLRANKGTDRSIVFDGTNWIDNNKRKDDKLPQLNVACVPGLSGMADPVWATTGLPPEETWPAIRSVLNRELVLLRPRRADGIYSRGFYPPLFNTKGSQISDPLHYDESWSVSDLVPVDSFDFTGLQLPTAAGAASALIGAPGSVMWHYCRQNADYVAKDADGNKFVDPGMWKFVYPGRYDACPVSGTTYASKVPFPGSGIPLWGAHYLRSRNQGVEIFENPGPADDPDWLPTAPVTLGMSTTGGAVASNENKTASYPTRFPIQLHAEGWQRNPIVPTAWGGMSGATNEVKYPAPAKFPFGGFGRNGDLLQVPFIGAYRISWQADPGSYPTAPAEEFENTVPGFPKISTAAPPPGDAQIPGRGRDLVELNSITIDSVFAEDTDLDDDPRFQMPKPATPDYVGNIDAAEFKKAQPLQKFTQDDKTTQGREQVGRFAPLLTTIRGGDDRFEKPNGVPDVIDPQAEYVDWSLGGTPLFSYKGVNWVVPKINRNLLINDYGYDPSYRPPGSGSVGAALQVGADWEPYWRYRWATRLFDFVTAQAPHDDALADAPAHQPWQYHTDYTVGQVVQYSDPHKLMPNGKKNPLYMMPCLYVCTKNHNSGPEFLMGFQSARDAQRPSNAALEKPENQDPTPNWHMIARMPLANTSTAEAGNSTDARTVNREYPQGVEGLININTADWKVLSTLPLVVSPETGLQVDLRKTANKPDVDVVFPKIGTRTRDIRSKKDGHAITWRELNEELARVIAYYRDSDGQPHPAGWPPNHPALRIPHGPYKTIFELNQAIDLRPFNLHWQDRNDPSNPNPFRGFGFADGLGAYLMPFRDLHDDTNLPPVDEVWDPSGAVGDLSPGTQEKINSIYRSITDGVRGDFEEQFLQLSRISNLITTRSDTFTTYIIVQGWRNAGTPKPELVVQKRVAYIIDRSRSPYEPVKKTLIPND
ncbi:MAG TPA: hypothetical protein VF669_23665 [Tepidisphaeraceae bacterium]|jgi:hypothetical protein